MNNINHSVEIENIYKQSRLFDRSLINNAAVITTLLFILLVSWGDSIWDGLPRVVATIAMGLSFVQLFVHGTHRKYTYFHFIALVYFVWQLISMMWSPDSARAEILAKTTIQLIFLTLLFSIVIDNKSKLRASYQAYVFGSIAASGIVFSSFLQGVQSGYLRYGINNLTIDAVGVFLAISIPMAAYLAKVSERKLLKLINVLAIPLIFYAIFLTATRTAFVVGILGLAYWVYTQRNASFKVKIIIAVVMVVSISTIMTFAPKSSIERVFTTGESITKGTLNYRSVIWGGSIEQWKESPIAGVGLGGLGHALGKEHINYNAAHNSFIHILTENGIIGLVLYLAVHISLLFYILHTPLDEKVFLISLFMVIVVSQLSTHLQSEKIAWFVYTMLAIHSRLFASIQKKY